MSKLKTFNVELITKGYFSGTIKAASNNDAVERTFDLWCNASPHPFEKDDHELVSVVATEVRS